MYIAIFIRNVETLFSEGLHRICGDLADAGADFICVINADAFDEDDDNAVIKVIKFQGEFKDV